MNTTLKYLLIFKGVFAIGANLLGPIYGLFVEEIGADLFLISASYATYIFSSAFFGVLAIKLLTPRFSSKKLFVSGLILRAVIYLSYIFVNDYTAFLFIQVVLGFTEAISVPSYNVLFFRNLSKDNETNNYFVRDIGYKISEGTGVFIGGLMALHSFSLVFLTASIFCFAAAIGSIITINDVYSD